MLLNAVIIPPPEARAAVALVLRSVEGLDKEPLPPPPPSRFWRRRPQEVAPTPPEDVGHELDLVPATSMALPIAGFGNVTAGDATRLADALQDAAAAWPRPTVHLEGGAALEFADDRSVWARLEGDLPGLVAVADGVVKTVASRGFFVDRRKFRPWLSVATITDTTTASHLERVVAALDAFRGEPWTVEWVAVTRPSFDRTLGDAQDVYRIPLAAPERSGQSSDADSSPDAAAPSSSLTTAKASPAA